MSELRGTAFVPGCVSGMLRLGADPADNHSIVMLTQQHIAELDTRPAGIVIVDGAMLSHPMIRLLTLGIPSVIVSSEDADRLEPGREAFIDGHQGIIIQPPPSNWPTTPVPEPPVIGEAISLEDGSEVRLHASIFSIENALDAKELGAAAIGLVRTEFLVPEQGGIPDTDFYERTLRELVQKAHPLAVTLRLPDITPDKPAPWFEPETGMTGKLGLQGVRLYSEEPVKSVVNAVLEGVNRLSGEHELSLLLPYVTRLDEFHYWRRKIEHRLTRMIPIGVMAETPAAVLAMAHWFTEADFVAIGCNDLMQCLFAADRDLVELSRYLDPYAPELFNFLQHAATAAGKNINKVQLCGLLPQIPGVLPVLLGMGFRVFSVAPVMIPYLANKVNETDPAEAEALARRVCSSRHSQQVRDLL